MSITAAELLFFGALNGATTQGPRTDDASTIGGDIDLAWCPSFTQIAQAAGATAKVRVASNGTSDGTKKLVVVGRDFTGTVVTDTIAISATANTFTLGSLQFERIQQAYVTASDGVTKTVPAGTITVTDNAGTPNTLGTIGGTGLGSQYGFYMLFENSASDPSVSKTRYEIIYAKNTDATLSLTSAQVTLTVDASGKLSIALANATGAMSTTTNRVTAPGSISAFSGVGSAIAVPGGSLAAGGYIGIVVKQALLAGDAAQKNPFTVQLQGNTV